MEEGGESEQEIEDDAEVEVDEDEKKDPLAPETAASLLNGTTPETLNPRLKL